MSKNIGVIKKQTFCRWDLEQQGWKHWNYCGNIEGNQWQQSRFIETIPKWDCVEIAQPVRFFLDMQWKWITGSNRGQQNKILWVKLSNVKKLDNQEKKVELEN